MKVFKPLNINDQHGNQHTVSSMAQQNQVYQLLNKLQLCYDLVTPARELCNHEITLLELRCFNLGCWFPVEFPKENLKYKFHFLTYHAPEKAAYANTCGLESEQGMCEYIPYETIIKSMYK